MKTRTATMTDTETGETEEVTCYEPESEEELMALLDGDYSE